MKKEISVIGAFDRYNYGDLLFPYIMNFFYCKYLDTENYELKFYGLRKYKNINIPEIYETESIRRMPCRGIIINAGGNTLNAPIESLFADNIDNLFLYKSYSFISSLFSKKIVRIWLRKILRINSNYPYCIADRNVVYNSVGGSINKDILSDKNQKLDFSRNYMSVRDKRTYESVESIADAHLVPDSAIILSDLWNGAFLERKIRHEIYNSTKEEYIIFQISKGMINDKFEVKEIKKFLEHLPVKVWLVPIGKVNSHGDLNILNQIFDDKRKYIYYKDIGVYETTYVITNALGFIGSSLHGNLISFSYGIPSILISKDNTKNKDYYDTWLRGTSCKTCSLDELLHQNLYFEKVNYDAIVEQKQLVYENFRLISDYIKSL